MFPVFDFIPTREISRLRRQPSPTVAWHALDSESAGFPLSVVLAMLLCVLAVHASRYFLVVPSRAWLPSPLARLARRKLPSLASTARITHRYTFSIPTPSFTWSWLADPFGTKTHAARLAQMHERYRTAVDKFAKLAHRYRALQAQLKDRDERLLRQGLTMDATAETLAHAHAEASQLRAEHRALAAAHERLQAARGALEQRAVDEFHAHARQLREREAEGAALVRAVAALEADQAAAQNKLAVLAQENDALRAHAAELAAALAHQRETGVHAEAALEESVRCNESLLHQLHAQHEARDRFDRAGDAVAAQRAGFHAALVAARRENDALREQLAAQEEAHAEEQGYLAEQVAAAKADRRNIKAKLRKARDDLRLQSTDIARLEAQAAQHQDRYAQQRDSFREDLHFVHVESECARDMYTHQLTASHAEAAALRTALADAVSRYESQTSRLRAAHAGLRDAAAAHAQLQLRLRAAAAEKQAADDLEHMLSDALRREQDRYETLEISFDVLESAYSFLARELVRTEHALEDARRAQLQLRAHTNTPAPAVIPLPSSSSLASTIHAPADDAESDYAPDAFERQQHLRALAQMYAELDDEDDDEDGGGGAAGAWDDSQATASVCSDDRSWPATPGLTRSMHSTTTSISSPIVTTPPLPLLALAPLAAADRALAKHLPPGERDDFFGPWTAEPEPYISG